MAKEKNIAYLAPLVVISVIAVFAVAGFFIFQKSVQYGAQTQNSGQEIALCAQDAKICPDGTPVSRVPPSCDFAECPASILPETKVYTNSVTGIELQYPAKLNSQYFTLQEPVALKKTAGDKEVQNGCFIGGQNSAQIRQKIKINDTEFCFSQSYDPGAGTGNNLYYFAFLRNNEYFIINFSIRQPNSCSPYYGTENLASCLNEFQNYQTIVDKPITESLATIKFLQ